MNRRDHQNMRALISAWVDGELEQAAESVIRNHLASCPRCAGYERELRAISDGMHSIVPADLPLQFPSAVVRAIRNETAESRIWQPAEVFARKCVTGLAALVVIFVGVAMTTQPEEPVVAEPYLVGEPADSAATRTLLSNETLSKSDILLAVMSKD